MKNLLLSAFILLLSGCAANYTVKTNVDRENFKHYFSPVEVKIYSSEQDINGEYQLVGIVEGEDCQTKAHHQQPDEIVARTNARRQAYNKKANAIIFTGCALIEKNQADKQCIATTVCYGKAYQVEKNND